MFFYRILFPKFCVGCGWIGSYLCYKCYEKTIFLATPLRLPKTESLDVVQAAAEFSFPIDKLIKELKYKGVKKIGKTCGRLLYYTVALPTADLVTAVPLHKKRQTERRFNQSEVVAQELARLLHKPYLPLLVRTKHTRNLASIHDKQMRSELMTNCFAINPKYSQINLKRVLLVDDVVTSGSTMNECAKVLKNRGFSQVFGLAVAHGG